MQYQANPERPYPTQAYPQQQPAAGYTALPPSTANHPKYAGHTALPPATSNNPNHAGHTALPPASANHPNHAGHTVLPPASANHPNHAGHTAHPPATSNPPYHPAPADLSPASPPYHTNYAAYDQEARHFTFDEQDVGRYDPRSDQHYGGAASNAMLPPRSQYQYDQEPAQGYSGYADPKVSSRNLQDVAPAAYYEPRQTQLGGQRGQYPSGYHQDAEYYDRSPVNDQYSGRELERYVSHPSYDEEYRDYYPEREYDRGNPQSPRYYQGRQRFHDDIEYGYSSAEEDVYQTQRRREQPKGGRTYQPPRKYPIENGKSNYRTPDYGLHRYNMNEMARALPPSTSTRPPPPKRDPPMPSHYNEYKGGNRGVRHQPSSAGYAKYGSPDFDYIGFKKRTSQLKELNRRSVEQARPPPVKYDRSRQDFDDKRYRSNYNRY
ncbi:RNA-binding motif protein, X chromosome-like [Hyalella azteca]|uniref:RNA-binding motif protein, X chromosome-like n=1 Tax=Hyalella azteca TaxID=294128 RepID=A0A8B7NK15_HYAAZ|nr:RNA-binding motif protein, X chromosome-like [Hyalella azteca]